MKTAVIYARYSSDTQTEQSIEGQLRVCNEYAKNNDILILRTYIDRAMTGTNDNRPDFRQMIEDSKKHDFNVVLVYKFDRFSRNKYETTKHKKTLKDNGVKVVSATEYIPDSPEAIILESMIEGYAEYYSAELSEKIQRGQKENALKCKNNGGNTPLGYVVGTDGVLAVEARDGHGGDEELAAVGVGACICHGKSTVEIVKRKVKFIFKWSAPNALAAATRTCGVTALYHKIFYYAVKNNTLVISVFSV